MISVYDLQVAWEKIRKGIPNDTDRLIAFRAMVKMLQDDGWDQDGYLYTLIGPWFEVNQFCQEEGLDLEEEE